MLVVIVIIGILASLVVGLSAVASRKMKESRTRAELNALITAIEAYKAKLGYYPPDNPDNPALNPLYYELVGTVYKTHPKNPRTGRFIDPLHGDEMKTKTIKEYFKRDGFVNTARSQSQVISFFDPKDDQVKEVSEEQHDHEGHKHQEEHSDVLVAPVTWPLARKDHPVRHHGRVIKGLNPWRYVSSNPTNNIGQFDLWAEIVVGGHIHDISNWRKDSFHKHEK